MFIVSQQYSFVMSYDHRLFRQSCEIVNDMPMSMAEDIEYRNFVLFYAEI